MRFKYDINNKNDLDDIQKKCEALASPIRVNIMHQLINQDLSIYELAKLNHVSVSSIIFHLKILEDAKLIIITTSSGTKEKKIVNRYGQIQSLSIELSLTENIKQDLEKATQTVPVGAYVDADMGDESGIVFNGKIVPIHNNAPYRHDRFEAVSLFLNSGYVEYSFNNDQFRNKEVSNLTITLEICSEAPYYNNEFKSDITFYINGIEILTYTSIGDYGGRKGRYTQQFTSNNFSEFGKLEVITVNAKGVYIGEKLVNEHITLDDLKINKGNCVKFKVESKKDAKNQGGFNIFCRGSGDYNQDIEMQVTYKDDKK